MLHFMPRDYFHYSKNIQYTCGIWTPMSNCFSLSRLDPQIQTPDRLASLQITVKGMFFNSMGCSHLAND